jgi:[NiFe] hydrogenase small subunit
MFIKKPHHGLVSEIDPNSRREFLKLCGAVAATLGLGSLEACNGDVEGPAERIAELLMDTRPRVIWLNFSECTGCTEATLRSTSPTFLELILDRVSLDYHETLLAASGTQAEALLSATVAENAGSFFCIVEGAIPTADNGNFGRIGDRTMLAIAQEICPLAKAILAVGTCASFGGLPAAAPNPTGAKGVKGALPNLTVPVVNLPGCPPNPINVMSVIVNYLLNGTLPGLDSLGRPTFAYQKYVHALCPYRQGSSRCLRSVGCKGTITHNNCPSIKFNQGTSFPMLAGHPCIGCSEPDFWDKMTPFYQAI